MVTKIIWGIHSEAIDFFCIDLLLGQFCPKIYNLVLFDYETAKL